MKAIILIILLSSCSSQYIVVKKQTNFGGATFRYEYDVVKVNTNDTTYLETNNNYKLNDTIK